MIYVLAYPTFAPSIAAQIDTFRSKHEPERASLVPPHVTLVFGVGDRHHQSLSDLLDMEAEQTRAIRIIFDRSVVEFDPFERTHKLFLLCGDGAAGITALHIRLYGGPHRSDLSAEHPFKPHMTIASHRLRSTAQQIDLAEIGDLPIQAELSSLTMVRLADGCLTELKRVAFRS